MRMPGLGSLGFRDETWVELKLRHCRVGIMPLGSSADDVGMRTPSMIKRGLSPKIKALTTSLRFQSGGTLTTAIDHFCRM